MCESTELVGSLMADVSKVILKFIIAFVYLFNAVAFSSTVESSSEQILTPLTDPDLRDYFKTMEDFAKGLESGSDKAANTSVFGLKNQRVEMFNKVISLDQGQLEITKPAFTSLKYSIDPEKKEFIVEGISGADKQGLNGKTVAKHIFSNFDVASVVADNLLIVIVEKSGKISVIPKSIFIHYGFEAPVPVFRNVNGSPLKFNDSSKVKSEFLTIGSKPISSTEVRSQKVLAEEYEAGQLLIWEQDEKSERSNLVRLPMISLLNFVNVGLRYLNAATQLVSLDKKNVTELESILKDLHENKEVESFENLREKMSAEETQIITKYSSERIKKALSVASQLKGASLSPKDKFSMQEWEAEYKNMHEAAQKSYEEQVQSLNEKDEKRFAITKKILNFLGRNQVVDPEDFKPDAKNYQTFITKNESSLRFEKSSTQVFKENINKTLKSKAVTFLMIGAPISAFYSLPYYYDSSETMKQVQSLSFMYENIIPDVLKDSAYRTPLIISTVIQIAIIPLVYLSAWSYKNVIKGLAYVYRNSNSTFGLKVKDFAAKYGELTTTQVLLTLNVRFFSMIVTPYWKSLIEGLLGQRTFFSAARRGLNPFKRISKDSELGKSLNLEKSSFVGLGLPLPLSLDSKAANQAEGKDNYLAKAQQAKEINLKIQEALSEQKKSIEMTAWLLATKALSEKYQLDPATLYITSELKKVNSEEVSKILSDEALKKKWEILSAQLIKEFKNLETFKIENLRTAISAEQFASLYSIAQDSVEKLSKQSANRIELQSRFLRFKKGLNSAKDWAVNLGEKESKFLKQVVPGKYVGQQVNQDFPVDQIMVSGISGVVGDMADLKKTEYLMADKTKLLYTSDAQMYSVATNIYGHLVSSAATLSLLNDTIKDQDETRYEPREYTKIKNQEWSPSFLKSSKSWALFAGNPLKSDVGGLAVKRYITRMNTIFASITFTLVSRVLVSSQGIGSAFKAYLLGFFLSHKVFGWPWDFIQAGNKRLGEEAAENSEKLKAIQYKLSQGIRETNEVKSLQLIEEAYSEAIEAYAKNNPQAIKQLMTTIKEVYSGIELQEAMAKIDLKKLSPESLKYIGLFSQLVVAKENGNADQFEKIKTTIVDLYSQNKEINTLELRKLDAQGLLALTQTAPPVPTKENGIVTWVTSILFGAILTTVLYTQLAPILMDPTYLAQPNVVWDALLSCLKFTGIYYLLLGKKPWEFYIKTYQKGKTYVNNLKENFSLTNILNKKPSYSRAQSCLKYY
jgi:hypothetical protein